MAERHLLRAVVRVIKKFKAEGYPIYYFKTHGEPAGIPDIVLCVKGRFVGIELKTYEGKTSKLQDIQGQRIQKAGGLFFVVRSPQELEDILKQILGAGGDGFCMSLS